MTRGHNSQYGIGCVVEVLTGLVIDLQVMSLYCQHCAYAITRHGGMATMEFKDWFRTHEPECNRNYKGASGNVELEKAECINHVAKQLGTALRKLAASGKKAGITFGGRGFGKLTQATINKLTAYYGKAVRAHPKDVDRMRDAILATFDNAISNDEKPQHDRCPVGADRWCFYQKALATGQEPGPHRTNVGTPLSSDVAEHVTGVYTRLAHVDLLKRCKLGKTQNSNETVHSVIRNKCPKTSFVGLERDVSAKCSAVSEFNAGVKVTMKNLCDVMQVP